MSTSAEDAGPFTSASRSAPPMNNQDRLNATARVMMPDLHNGTAGRRSRGAKA
jgi:hypothetical protein